MRSGERIELAFEADPVLAAPNQADDLDRLLERRHRLAGSPNRTAVCLDRLPEPTRPEPELDAAGTQQVESRRSLGEDRRANVSRDVQHAGQPTADDVAKDVDDDVTEPAPAFAQDDTAGEEAGDQADHDRDDDVFECHCAI